MYVITPCFRVSLFLLDRGKSTNHFSPPVVEHVSPRQLVRNEERGIIFGCHLSSDAVQPLLC